MSTLEEKWNELADIKDELAKKGLVYGDERKSGH